MNSAGLNKRIELIQWLSTVEDDFVLEKLEAIQFANTKDWWDTISTTEQESIESGILDIKTGRLNNHVVGRGLYEKWL